MAIAATDEALLQMIDGIRNGDRKSMDQLFMTMYSGLYNYAARMIGANDAEDAVNETMLQVWMSIDKFKGESKVSTWIFGVLRILCLKHYQTQSAKKRQNISYVDTTDMETEKEYFYQEASRATDLAHESDDLHQTMEEIEKYIVQLSAEQRSALLLIAEGYTYQEIGQIEKCPENTAKTRVFHARKRLKELMKEDAVLTA